MIPLTGVPLPFISYGGSALAAVLLAAGVLASISRFTEEREAARERTRAGKQPPRGGTNDESRARSWRNGRPHLPGAGHPGGAAGHRRAGGGALLRPDNRGERTLVQGHDVPFEAVPAAPLRGRSPLALARGLARTALGVAAALRALRRFRPNVMLSTGGYGSFPPSVAARVLRLPLVVFLPDVEPGLAVRAESRLATLIAAATEAALPAFPPGRRS